MIAHRYSLWLPSSSWSSYESCAVTKPWSMFADLEAFPPSINASQLLFFRDGFLALLCRPSSCNWALTTS